MINRSSFWNDFSISRARVVKPGFECFPGTRYKKGTLARKLQGGKNFTIQIKPELTVSIERISYYDQFNGSAIVVKGPNAHYVCHSVTQAAHQTEDILRSYNRLVREKNLRDRMRVFDTTGEG